MAWKYRIIPGESVGPFKLGMTREEIGSLRVRPNTSEKGFPTPGIYVFYDEEGRCNKLHAVFSYKRKRPIFTLFGKIVNGMTDREFRALVGGTTSYASVDAPSLGISGTKWERTDERIMSITVVPKR